MTMYLKVSLKLETFRFYYAKDLSLKNNDESFPFFQYQTSYYNAIQKLNKMITSIFNMLLPQNE